MSGQGVVAAGGLADVGDMLVRGGAAIAALTAAVGGGVLVLRRLVDAIDTAAPPALLLASVAAGSVLVLVADLGPRSGRVGPILARVGLVLAAVALAVPPGPTFAAWVATAASLIVTAGLVFRQPRAVTIPALPALNRPRRRAEPAAEVPVVRPARRRRIRRLPGSLRQRLVRYELPDGVDCVRGRLTIAVPAAAKAAAGHVGFCPTFAATPEVEVSTEYDGVEVTVAAAEVLPWGARVECRLAEPAEEPLEIPVDIVARAALVR